MSSKISKKNASHSGVTLPSPLVPPTDSGTVQWVMPDNSQGTKAFKVFAGSVRAMLKELPDNTVPPVCTSNLSQISNNRLSRFFLQQVFPSDDQLPLCYVSKIKTGDGEAAQELVCIRFVFHPSFKLPAKKSLFITGMQLTNGCFMPYATIVAKDRPGVSSLEHSSAVSFIEHQGQCLSQHAGAGKGKSASHSGKSVSGDILASSAFASLKVRVFTSENPLAQFYSVPGFETLVSKLSWLSLAKLFRDCDKGKSPGKGAGAVTGTASVPGSSSQSGKAAGSNAGDSGLGGMSPNALVPFRGGGTIVAVAGGSAQSGKAAGKGAGAVTGKSSLPGAASAHGSSSVPGSSSQSGKADASNAGDSGLGGMSPNALVPYRGGGTVVAVAGGSVAVSTDCGQNRADCLRIYWRMPGSMGMTDLNVKFAGTVRSALRRYSGSFPWVFDQDESSESASIEITYRFLTRFFPSDCTLNCYVSNINIRDDLNHADFYCVRIPCHPYFPELPENVSLCVIGRRTRKTDTPYFHPVRASITFGQATAAPYELRMQSTFIPLSSHDYPPSTGSGYKRNLFRSKDVAGLSPFAMNNAERFSQWGSFLNFKYNLVRYRAQGLRYISWNYEQQSGSLVFAVVAPDRDTLYKACSAMRRQSMVAYKYDVSSDVLSFELNLFSKGILYGRDTMLRPAFENIGQISTAMPEVINLKNSPPLSGSNINKAGSAMGKDGSNMSKSGSKGGNCSQSSAVSLSNRQCEQARALINTLVGKSRSAKDASEAVLALVRVELSEELANKLSGIAFDPDSDQNMSRSDADLQWHGAFDNSGGKNTAGSRSAGTSSAGGATVVNGMSGGSYDGAASGNEADGSTGSGEPDSRLKKVFGKLPDQGFISISLVGDISLISRHRAALRNLYSNESCYAPYLAGYLFDITSARTPETMEDITVWYNSSLNEAQKQAVRKMISAPDICLIQGPPGTGKTTVIAEACMQLAARGNRILLASQSHDALDNALSRLQSNPKLRGIRLARFSDRITTEGMSFTAAAALGRHYHSVANALQNVYLDRYDILTSAVEKLDSWTRDFALLTAQLESSTAQLATLENRKIECQRELSLSELRLRSNELDRLKISELQAQREFLQAVQQICSAVSQVSGSVIPDAARPVGVALSKSSDSESTNAARPASGSVSPDAACSAGGVASASAVSPAGTADRGCDSNAVSSAVSSAADAAVWSSRDLSVLAAALEQHRAADLILSNIKWSGQDGFACINQGFAEFLRGFDNSMVKSAVAGMAVTYAGDAASAGSDLAADSALADGKEGGVWRVASQFSAWHQINCVLLSMMMDLRASEGQSTAGLQGDAQEQLAAVSSRIAELKKQIAAEDDPSDMLFEQLRSLTARRNELRIRSENSSEGSCRCGNYSELFPDCNEVRASGDAALIRQWLTGRCRELVSLNEVLSAAVSTSLEQVSRHEASLKESVEKSARQVRQKADEARQEHSAAAAEIARLQDSINIWLDSQYAHEQSLRDIYLKVPELSAGLSTARDRSDSQQRPELGLSESGNAHKTGRSQTAWASLRGQQGHDQSQDQRQELATEAADSLTVPEFTASLLRCLSAVPAERAAPASAHAPATADAAGAAGAGDQHVVLMRQGRPWRPDVDDLVRLLEEQNTVLAALRSRLDDYESSHKQLLPFYQKAAEIFRNADRRAADDWAYVGRSYIDSCNVVAMSCNENERTLYDNNMDSFDVVIIDEVSKATPLELLLPLMRAPRAVLVGDHRQLPPVFNEADGVTFSDLVDRADAARNGADKDSSDEGYEDPGHAALTQDNLIKYEKMVTASLFKELFEQCPDSLRQRLNVQFRMHPGIMRLINCFYDGQLVCGNPQLPREHGISFATPSGTVVMSKDHHVLWVDTTLNEKGESYRISGDINVNEVEARLIARTLVDIDRQCALAGYGTNRRLEVGVVSFYQPQCRVIREAIASLLGRRRNLFSAIDVDINTVIRYQGKEKPVILLSLVKNNGGPIEQRFSPGRANIARFEFINVAMSRAQNLLMVFGARNMLQNRAVKLPRMDSKGYDTTMVYQNMFNYLEFSAEDGSITTTAEFIKTLPDVNTVRSRSRAAAAAAHAAAAAAAAGAGAAASVDGCASPGKSKKPVVIHKGKNRALIRGEATSSPAHDGTVSRTGAGTGGRDSAGRTGTADRGTDAGIDSVQRAEGMQVLSGMQGNARADVDKSSDGGDFRE